MERTINNLRTLRNNLNSYACEPRTPSLFKQKYHLSRDLEALTKNSAAVLYDLRTRETPMDDALAYLKQQQQKVLELEQKVLDYIGRAKFLA